MEVLRSVVNEVAAPTVMVIEDQPEMAAAIKRVLRRAGYDVELVADGFMAGSRLSRSKPDLVTLDLKMPGIDGHEVLSYIRGHKDLAHTKVLVISAESDKDLHLARQLGASDVLSKPFENSDLLDKVANLT